MIDFKKSLSEAIEVAKKARSNKEEVQDVFAELNKQLDEATTGSLLIEIRKENEPVSIAKMMTTLSEPKTYFAIVAKNPKFPKVSAELARWFQDASGYPCRISAPEGGSIYCEDRASLEKALSDLLKKSVVAQELYRLINLEVVQK